MSGQIERIGFKREVTFVINRMKVGKVKLSYENGDNEKMLGER